MINSGISSPAQNALNNILERTQAAGVGRLEARLCLPQDKGPTDTGRPERDRLGCSFSGIKARLEQSRTAQASRRKRCFGEKER